MENGIKEVLSEKKIFAKMTQGYLITLHKIINESGLKSVNL